MKKIFYNNWLAKHFLPFAHTIAIGPFVLSKRESLSQGAINHECVHTRQWGEMTISSGALVWLLVLLFDLNAWWLMIALFTFYIWYLLEFLIRLIKLFNRKKAYKAISFEQEAAQAENDYNYLENSHYFAWIKYL